MVHLTSEALVRRGLTSSHRYSYYTDGCRLNIFIFIFRILKMVFRMFEGTPSFTKSKDTSISGV